MRVAGRQRAISRSEDRDFLQRYAKNRQRIIKSTVEEMRHADTGQMVAPLPTRVEAHRSLEVLDSQIGVSGKQAKPTAPIPSKRETRVEHESPIDQGEGGVNIHPETPEHDRRPAEHTWVVWGEADRLPGQLDSRPAIFLLGAIVGPVVVFKIDAVGSGLGQKGAVTRLARNRLPEQVE